MPTAAQMADNLANAMRQAVVSLITADGIVEDEEKTVGLEVMQRYTDTVYTMADLEEDISNLKHGDLVRQVETVAGILNDHGKESLTTACLQIAAADGSIDESELDEVHKAGVALGMSQAHIKGVIVQADETMGS